MRFSISFITLITLCSLNIYAADAPQEPPQTTQAAVTTAPAPTTTTVVTSAAAPASPRPLPLFIAQKKHHQLIEEIERAVAQERIAKIKRRTYQAKSEKW